MTKILGLLTPFLILMHLPAATPSRVAFAHLPLGFEQAAGGVLVAHDGPYTLAVEPGHTTLTIVNRRSRQATSLTTTLAGARPHSRVVGSDPLPGTANYLLGNNPKEWHVGLVRFARALDHDVYPGIDLVFHGAGGTLEYDFVVQPGADARRIALSISGARSIRLTHDGKLALATPAGDVLWDRPAIYQWNGNQRQPVRGGFAVHGRMVTFSLGAYDRSRTLIIDPALAYSSFLGGTDDEGARGITVDSSGNIYITGFSFSRNLPNTGGSFQPSYKGGSVSSILGGDAFVAKFSSTGALAYVTYLGGSSNDAGTAIAVDSTGNAYVTGYTTSGDFPTTSAAYQRTFGGGQGTANNDGVGGDAFVAKLNATGTALVYSTYLGGLRDEVGYALAVDASGNAYVGGTTNSQNFPTRNPFQASFGGSGGMPSLPCAGCGPLMDEGDGFVAKLNPGGSDLVYSTYLGGHFDDAVTSLAADSSGNLYVGGFTLSNDFPVLAGGYQTKFGGLPSDSVQPEIKFGDGFVTKLDATGKPAYSTYLGGVADDAIFGVAIDSAGAAYVTGFTSSTNFPATPKAAQPTLRGPTGVLNIKDLVWGDAFVAKLSPSGSSLNYATFLGGSDDDAGMAIAVDSAGEAFVVGFANSTDFPLSPDALQKTMAGSGLGGYRDPTGDGFVTKLSADGSSFLYSSYFGGSKDDAITSVALGAQGNVYVSGSTTSANIPITAGAAQPTFGGLAEPSETMGDAFVAVFSGMFSSGGTVTGGNGPVITDVQNGASFAPGVIADAWLTIKGSNLSAVQDDWSHSVIGGKLPTSLDGVTVTLGGQAAYIEAVSPGQINVVAPDLPPGPVQVVVSNSSGTSSPFSSTVQIFGPAFFLWPGGYAVATRTDFTPAVKPGTFPGLTTVAPKPGDTIILWGSGFGPTNPPMPVGVALPSDATYRAANPITVTVGGVPAEFLGAALGPGFASAYLIAIQVPPSLANGDYPVVATVNGVQSPATTLLTVQQ